MHRAAEGQQSGRTLSLSLRTAVRSGLINPDLQRGERAGSSDCPWGEWWVCQCVCLCVSLSVRVCLCTYVGVCMCAFVCLCLYVFSCVCLCLSMCCVSICLSMNVCTCLCLCMRDPDGPYPWCGSE